MTDRLGELSNFGVAVWLDDISRTRIQTDNLRELMDEKHVVGVTSNPTIFSSAIRSGKAYNDQLRDLDLRSVGVEEASRAITTADIRAAADVLRPVYEKTGGVDGRVSLEVDPRLSNNTEATIAEAKALWWAVDRRNAFIKIPATPEGLPAITATLAAGISVNVTLIFSLERYKSVIDAFFTGMEEAHANGHDLSELASVASFFVSRVDTEVDQRLEKIGTPEALALRGKAAVANARLAYQAYEEAFSSERWRALSNNNAQPQRPLWASTGTKNPEYSDTLYVTELVAPGTVNTMPEKTLDAVADHAEFHGDAIRDTYDESAQVLEELEAVGVSYDDVVLTLENEGVEKFKVSWNEFLRSIEEGLTRAKP